LSFNSTIFAGIYHHNITCIPTSAPDKSQASSKGTWNIYSSLFSQYALSAGISTVLDSPTFIQITASSNHLII
jgi:hypothetical protein